jgi:hypothetical protein
MALVRRDGDDQLAEGIDWAGGARRIEGVSKMGGITAAMEQRR